MPARSSASDPRDRSAAATLLRGPSAMSVIWPGFSAARRLMAAEAALLGAGSGQVWGSGNAHSLPRKTGTSARPIRQRRAFAAV
eukprot:2428092-Prymnesium_polylepis.1